MHKEGEGNYLDLDHQLIPEKKPAQSDVQSRELWTVNQIMKCT